MEPLFRSTSTTRRQIDLYLGRTLKIVALIHIPLEKERRLMICFWDFYIRLNILPKSILLVLMYILFEIAVVWIYVPIQLKMDNR